MKNKRDDKAPRFLEDEKLNLAQIAIIGTAMIVFVLLFCFIVWKVTHSSSSPDIVIQNSEMTDSIAGIGSGQGDDDFWDNVPDDLGDPDDSSNVSEPDNNLGMSFAEVYEEVTAKDVTNLRSEPSTEQGQATVVTQLRNGTVAIRTGINEDSGWSRLEYDGKVLYAVSTYLLSVSGDEQE